MCANWVKYDMELSFLIGKTNKLPKYLETVEWIKDILRNNKMNELRLPTTKWENLTNSTGSKKKKKDHSPKYTPLPHGVF